MTQETVSLIYSEFGHDEDFAELIEMFVDALPDRMAGLSAAISNQDIAEGRRLAHQLKGAFGSYGFHELTEGLKNLELVLHEGSSREQIHAALDAVLDKVSLVRKGPGPT